MPHPIKFALINHPMQFTLQASAAGNILMFENAILARAEVNKNSDEIDEAGVSELAATIGLQALDVEHDALVNCGAFLEGTPFQDPELGWVTLVKGFIWADRFPNEAAGIQRGTHALSIEAEAELAICSICGQEFTGSTKYCAHLQNQFKSGAVRRMKGLKARGGGVVRSPAGNGTDFRQATLRFVANHAPLEAPAMKNCPFCGHEVAEGAEACSSCHHSLTPTSLMAAVVELTAKVKTADEEKANTLTASNTMSAEFEAAKTKILELEAQVTEATAKVATLDATTTELATSKTALAELQTKLTAAETAKAALVLAGRRAAIGDRMTAAEWEVQKTVIQNMTDEQFETMRKLAKLTVVAAIRTDADNVDPANQGDIKITL